MTPEDPLSARIDHNWVNVVLRVDGVRSDTLRAIASLWATNPDRVTDVLDYLAEAAVVGRVGVWESALENVPGDLNMAPAELSLSETQAVQLADELSAASRATLTARLRGPRLVEVPPQQDRSAA